MKLIAMMSMALALVIFPGLDAANADDNTNRFEFSAPTFSFGFDTKGSGNSEYAPLDDDFPTSRPPVAPRPYAERNEPGNSDLAPLDDDYDARRPSEPPQPYAGRSRPGYDEYDDRDRRSLKDGEFDDRSADGKDYDYLSPPETQLALGCLSRDIVGINLRAAGWRNFRNRRYYRHKVKLTADNLLGIPFRLTIHRCTGAILFARPML